jgi:hypothetical protein
MHAGTWRTQNGGKGLGEAPLAQRSDRDSDSAQAWGLVLGFEPRRGWRGRWRKRERESNGRGREWEGAARAGGSEREREAKEGTERGKGCARGGAGFVEHE